jgi:hypothetical protein
MSATRSTAANTLANAAELIELEERERRLAARETANRIWRAMMLAPSLEVCEALLRGESIPLDRLDREWSRRFGRCAA